MESQSFLQRPSSRADKGMSHSLMDCLPACLPWSFEILLIRKKLHSTLLRLRWSPANGRRAQDQATIPFVSFQLCSAHALRLRQPHASSSLICIRVPSFSISGGSEARTVYEHAYVPYVGRLMEHKCFFLLMLCYDS